MAYKLGNYEFRTKKEYDEACKELKLVKQIRDKYNISDPKIASQLLASIERGDKIKFKTSIGKAFIEILRKNAKIQVKSNAQVTKPANSVPVKRETVNTRYNGTRNGWQTEASHTSRRSSGGWQTDNQYGNERKRHTWENSDTKAGRSTSYKSDEPQQMEKKKIKVKKKDWKEYHTGRKILIYLFMLIAGGVLSSFYMQVTDLSSHNMMSDAINVAFFTIYGIGMCGFLITLWFGLLRLIYKQATAKRLWCITGYIFAGILVIALCCTGVGAIPALLAWSMVKKAIMGLIPTDEDRGLIEVEIEVPVTPKAKKIFGEFEITGYKEITEEEYRKYQEANKFDVEITGYKEITEEAYRKGLEEGDDDF